MKYALIFKSDSPLCNQDFEEAMRVALGVSMRRPVEVKVGRKVVKFTMIAAHSLEGIREGIYEKKDILDD